MYGSALDGFFIFTHGDTDGLCAGAVALAANPEAQIFFSNPYRLMEDLNLARRYDIVIVCDISLPENLLTQTLDRFLEISEKGSLTYIDHNPPPETVLKDDIPRKVVYSSLSSTSELGR